MAKRKIKKEPGKKTIDELQKEAQEHGMSYGQYVALLEQRKAKKYAEHSRHDN